MNTKNQYSKAALIFAGGVGSRMKTTGVPKQFIEIDGKPILIRTIEVFDSFEEIDVIAVVCLKSYIPMLRNMISKFHLRKHILITEGGSTGQESIYNGLQVLQSYQVKHPQIPIVVAIHDGVRPFIDEILIKKCFDTAIETGNCIAVAQAIETIAIKDCNGIQSILNRNDCLYLRAPQIFYLKDILEAHRKAIDEKLLDFVDSAQMMQYYGHNLHYEICDSSNIKITTAIDFYAAKGLVTLSEAQKALGI